MYNSTSPLGNVQTSGIGDFEHILCYPVESMWYITRKVKELPWALKVNGNVYKLEDILSGHRKG